MEIAIPLDHANLEQNKQSYRMSLAAGFKAGFEAASNSSGAIAIRTTESAVATRLLVVQGD